MDSADPYSEQLLTILLTTASGGLGGFNSFILLAILIFGVGLISAFEIAIFSLTPSDIEELRDDNENESAKILLYMRTHTKRLLAFLLIIITVLNIGIALVFEHLLDIIFPIEVYYGFSQKIINTFNISTVTIESVSDFLNFLIAVVGSTFIILLFGEVTPKIYGQLNNRKLSMSLAVPLRFLDLILSPLTFVLVSMSSRVEKKLLERRIVGSLSSKQDLDKAIDLAVSDELGSEKQIDMLKGIIKFNDVYIKQIMRPRTEIFALDFDNSFDSIVNQVKNNGYSRMPVFREDLDHMTGILYAKDLVPNLHQNKDFEWQSLMRSNLFYVPENRKIHDLLHDFQVKKVHMAIVVDEYGGTSGLVTLEDIMEQIVGEIQDEFDDLHDLNYTILDKHNYIFEGKTLINDMCRVLGLDIYSFDAIRGSADSIAGLILEKTNEMPKHDQEIHIQNLKFKIIQVNKKRIEKVKVTI
ncbi:MAG: gliding motility-associated protein GldE [Saprospiraceae bacterium]|nr:gliding motility-associated protein GldE [Saprospiraceae bacterium]